MLFGADKRRAKAGYARIKEKYLLSAAAYGGALGAFLGRIVFRHKTEKAHFSAVIFISLLLQAAAAAVLVLAYKGVL